MSLIIPTELFTNFNDVVYYDEPHKYYIGGSQLISVTTLIGKYVEDFKEDYWADIKGKEFNVSSDEIKKAWKFINEKGTFKGSLIHDYAENLFQNKVFPYKLNDVFDKFGFDPISSEYEITKNHVNKFQSDSKNKLIPIKTELVIYDKESLIGGMIDMIFYNVKAKEFQLWDYKTNKAFETESKYRMLYELITLDQSDLNVYSLQLGLYKYIIEKNTSIKLGKSYVVWFSHNNPTYKTIEMKNMEYYVKEMVDKRILEIAA